MERLVPRFRWGSIAPFTPVVDRGPGHQFYQIVPLDVMEIVVSLGIEDYTPEGVEAAIGNFQPCVELLAAEQVDRIVLGAAPISAQLGRERVRRLLDEMERATGIPGDAPLEAVIAAMGHLGLRRIAVGSKWADQLNEGLRRYLEAGGLEVVAITARGRWAKENAALSYQDGFQAALEVAREAARLAPEAEAIFSAGGPARTLPVIPPVQGRGGSWPVRSAPAPQSAPAGGPLIEENGWSDRAVTACANHIAARAISPAALRNALHNTLR